MESTTASVSKSSPNLFEELSKLLTKQADDSAKSKKGPKASKRKAKVKRPSKSSSAADEGGGAGTSSSSSSSGGGGERVGADEIVIEDVD